MTIQQALADIKHTLCPIPENCIDCKRIVVLVEFAETALREQEKQEQRAKACYKCGGTTPDELKQWAKGMHYKFCPECGKNLKEAAHV